MYQVNLKRLALGRHLKFQLSFNVKEGEKIWIQGVNGIGKSSLLEELKTSFFEFFASRTYSFVNQQRLNPFFDLTLGEFIESVSKQLKVPTNQELLSQLDLVSKLSHKMKELSGGENQLAKIYLMELLNGDIYFLDEPFQQLDTHKRKILEEILAKKTQKIILFTHHDNTLLSCFKTPTKYLLEKNKGLVTIKEKING